MSAAADAIETLRACVAIHDAAVKHVGMSTDAVSYQRISTQTIREVLAELDRLQSLFALPGPGVTNQADYTRQAQAMTRAELEAQYVATRLLLDMKALKEVFVAPFEQGGGP